METGFIYSISAAVTWGLVYTIDQKNLTGVSPAALLFIDSLLGAVIMLPFLFFSDGSIKTLLHSSKMNLALIVLSLVLATLANFLIFSGIKSTNASFASIIEIAYPFFVVLFSFIFFRTTPNIWFFVGGALIFFGSFLIMHHH